MKDTCAEPRDEAATWSRLTRYPKSKAQDRAAECVTLLKITLASTTAGTGHRLFVAREGDETVRLLVPMIWVGGRDMSYPELLKRVEHLLFDFCRKFIAHSLYLMASATYLESAEYPWEALGR